MFRIDPAAVKPGQTAVLELNVSDDERTAGIWANISSGPVAQCTLVDSDEAPSARPGAGTTDGSTAGGEARRSSMGGKRVVRRGSDSEDGRFSPQAGLWVEPTTESMKRGTWALTSGASWPAIEWVGVRLQFGLDVGHKGARSKAFRGRG
ncbi:hypothetical protein [Sphaerisporangium album]|uniref:hypothetical protein n=1 Tax=Sphaerisporangium album TaxID=509200 RepID=UPI0011C0766B|nr:hypothetical protein [Sphaerisporangium album]